MRIAAAFVLVAGLIGVTSAQTLAPAPWRASGNGVTLVTREGKFLGEPGHYEFRDVRMSMTNGVEIRADEATIMRAGATDTVALRGNVLATLPSGPEFGFVVVHTMP